MRVTAKHKDRLQLTPDWLRRVLRLSLRDGLIRACVRACVYGFSWGVSFAALVFHITSFYPRFCTGFPRPIRQTCMHASERASVVSTLSDHPACLTSALFMTHLSAPLALREMCVCVCVDDCTSSLSAHGRTCANHLTTQTTACYAHTSGYGICVHWIHEFPAFISPLLVLCMHRFMYGSIALAVFSRLSC